MSLAERAMSFHYNDEKHPLGEWHFEALPSPPTSDEYDRTNRRRLAEYPPRWDSFRNRIMSKLSTADPAQYLFIFTNTRPDRNRKLLSCIGKHIAEPILIHLQPMNKQHKKSETTPQQQPQNKGEKIAGIRNTTPKISHMSLDSQAQ